MKYIQNVVDGWICEPRLHDNYLNPTRIISSLSIKYQSPQHTTIDFILIIIQHHHQQQQQQQEIR